MINEGLLQFGAEAVATYLGLDGQPDTYQIPKGSGCPQGALWRRKKRVTRRGV